jgi:hypothetical protein
MGNKFSGLLDENGNYKEGTLINNIGTYTGTFKNNKLNGNGKCILKNNIILTGSFIDGKLNGDGKIYYKDGGYSEGNYIDNKLYGIGKKYVYNNNHIDKYEGTFINGYLNGNGEKHLYDGIYKGNFINDKLDGIGSIIYKNDFIYNGRIFNDYPHGYGKKKNKILNKKYIGLFLNGEIQKGKIICKDYDYCGDIKNEHPCGKGNINYKNGLFKYYIGYFKNGVIDGYGILTYRNDNIFIGFCEKGKKIYGELTLKDGSIYTGTFINEKIYYGTKKYNNVIYSGIFDESNNMNGLELTSTYLYIGNIIDGKKEGLGKILYIDIETGTFYKSFIGHFTDDIETNIGYTVKINYPVGKIIDFDKEILYQETINDKINNIITDYKD